MLSSCLPQASVEASQNMKMTKQRLVILGAGESGVGTALLGKEKGFEVFVSDKGTIKEKYKNVLINNEIEWEEKEPYRI